MNETKKITTKKLLSWFASILFPVFAIAVGCFLLFADAVFNLSFAVTYVIVPMVSIALLALIIFEVKKALPKVILTVFVLIAFVVSFLFSSALGTFEMLTYKQNAEIGENYTEVCEAFVSMPTLEEVGNYTKVEHYDYFSSCFGIFTCDADTLIVHYDSTEYQEQKNLLDSKYVFQKVEMTSCGYTCNPFAKINDYSFRVLDINEEYGLGLDYPKRLVFIATNDQDNSISYTAFYDDDLDYIESLEEFLLNDCGWKHIIK